VVQVAEFLPSKQEALNSNLNTVKKRKERKEEGRKEIGGQPPP
jgi:hypothetical protein